MPLPHTFAELQANGGVMVYLPRLAERAEHSLRRLSEVGFGNIVLEEGVDGHRVDPRALGDRRGISFDPGLSVGEMGCALSMIGLWGKVVEEERPYLLVFEDDVLPHPDIGRLGPEYWAETPRETDFVFLGNQLLVDNLEDPSQRVVSSPSWCLHAYVITHEGAQRALTLLRLQLSDEDRWLSPIDVEVRRWMELDSIRYSCWNGTMLPSPYPTADQHGGGGDVGPDVVRATRSTGLFFQNFALGSAIWPGQRPPADGTRRRQGKPKAILITPVEPSNRGNGLAMRAGVALEGLAWPFDVTLVVAPVFGRRPVGQWATERAARTFVLPDDVADPFLRLVGRMDLASERRRARLIYPRAVVSAWSTPAAAATVVELAGSADLVYIFRSYLAPFSHPWLSGDGRAGVVLDIDEDDPRALRQLAGLHRQVGDLEQAQMASADADKLAVVAEEWFPHADLIVAANAGEIASVHARFPDVPARPLPNPVPMRGSEGLADPSDLLFVANFGYPPNQDAARWLCREVLPRLTRQMGRAVRVALVGSALGPDVLELASPDVVITRSPASVTPAYEATTIAVAPLRAGGGTRLKILEAFGHRRAVVATSRGAEGLPVVAGNHLLLADRAEDFAAACARALLDSNLRMALVGAAVEVAIDLSWPRVAAMVSEIGLSTMNAVNGRGG